MIVALNQDTTNKEGTEEGVKISHQPIQQIHDTEIRHEVHNQ